jgi:uncharacterized protein (TIRG00374 family)
MARSGPHLLKQWQFWVKVLASLAIAVALGTWVHTQGIDLVPGAEDLSILGRNWWGPGGFLLALCFVHFFRAYRWMYLLRPLTKEPIRLGTVLAVAFVGFMAIMVLPLRTGELARPYLISTRGHVSMSCAFGTIAIERVIDGLVLSAVLTACLLATPLSADAPSWTRLAGVATLALFVVAGGVLVLLLWKGSPALDLLERIGSKIWAKGARKVAGVLREFLDGLAALPDRSHLLPFLLLTLVYWGINGVGMWILALGCGLPLPLIGAYTVMTLLAVGILFPSGPGQFGNFQAAVTFALAVQPIVQGEVEKSVFIFGMYVLMQGFTALAGLVSMMTHHVSLSRAVSGGEEEDKPSAAGECRP